MQSCDVLDTGDGGVSCRAATGRHSLPGITSWKTAALQRLGRWSKCYVPAILMEEPDCASHNLINDHPHAAICSAATIILLNSTRFTISPSKRATAPSTQGGITPTGATASGTITSMKPAGWGWVPWRCTWRLRQRTEVFGNVFYKVHWAMFIGGGRD